MICNHYMISWTIFMGQGCCHGAVIDTSPMMRALWGCGYRERWGVGTNNSFCDALLNLIPTLITFWFSHVSDYFWIKFCPLIYLNISGKIPSNFAYFFQWKFICAVFCRKGVSVFHICCFSELELLLCLPRWLIYI